MIADNNGIKLSILLEQNKNTYTKSDKKLYAYTKDHLDEVMYHSLTELAEICHVGEATVLRFCRKLGFNGYQDFKLAAAQELSLISRPHHDETYVEKIRSNMIDTLNDTYEVIDRETLDSVVRLIDQRKDVVIYGVGHSGISACDLKSRFMRIGKSVEVVTDPHFQMIRACSLDEESVVIAISLSGSTIDIVDAVSAAREQKATVVAITNYTKSPLTKLADHVLLTSGKENPMDGGSLVAKVSQLYVIDLLCTGLALERADEAQRMKNLTAESVSVKLY